MDFEATHSSALKLMGEPLMTRISHVYIFHAEQFSPPPVNPYVMLLRAWRMDMSSPPLVGSLPLLNPGLSDKSRP